MANNIVPIAKAAMVAYNEKDIALIRRTVAADTNDDEFNLFIHTARHLQLDPLRRQVYAFVYNKADPKKRRMSIIVGIDGFRAIADRTGNYRPDENPPVFEIDHGQKSPINPLGIISASVCVWKFSHGDWHKVTGIAYWDEFAPIKDEWAEGEDGRRRPTGKQTLDTSGQWGKMGRVMIAKCAEAQALRKAWPDDLSNVYEASEVDKTRILDMLPSEAAAAGEIAARQEKIGSKDSVPLTFDDAGTIEMIPIGKVADRCFEFLKEAAEEPSRIILWQSRNVAGLREFWAKAPNDALAVKKEIEKAVS